MVLIMDGAASLLCKPDNHSDNDHSEAERRGQKRKISLTSCDVCEADEAKYRCPSCMKCSCSLPCVKQHKLQSGCSGVRNRTAFVPVSQFNDIILLGDYRFLEETGRVAERPVRDSLLQTRTRHTFSVMLLKRKATAAKVTLNILPKFFSRRKENTSFFNKSEQKLYWHLKLIFPQSDMQYTDRVPEDRVLEKILDDYVHPTESDPVKRQRLKAYVLHPSNHLSVFMKSEQRRPHSPRYHKLDVKKSLRENLMFKTLVEYPELHVVLSGHHQDYLARVPESSSNSHRPPSDPQEAPESLKKKESTESELEDGEIRSEEDEDDQRALKDDDDGQVGNSSNPVMEADLPPITRGNDDAGGDEDPPPLQAENNEEEKRPEDEEPRQMNA